MKPVLPLQPLQPYVLSNEVLQIFIKALQLVLEDSSLTEEERETRRSLIISLQQETLSVIDKHQASLRKTSNDLFALANLVSKLGS